jgi:hypothetical protein
LTPEHEDYRLIPIAEELDHGIREGLPALPPMGSSLVGPHCQDRIAWPTR